MSLWEPEPPRLPGGPMTPGGGCRGWTPLLAGPDLCAGFPPLGKGTGASIFLRSSRKGSSFFGGLSAEDNQEAPGQGSGVRPRTLSHTHPCLCLGCAEPGPAAPLAPCWDGWAWASGS